jgi:tetratricopeptide (TPR) repeat protein
VSLLARIVLSALAALAVYYSVLFARSQSLLGDPSQPGNIALAVKLVPSNFAALVELSQLQTAHSAALLKQSLALNPRNAPGWARLGFAAEFQDHDLVLAEQSYLHAERVNRGFYSRSNLVNFYFRQQRFPEFKHWLPLALQMNSSNPRILFAELWAISTDGPSNLALIPNRPEILLAYADFLLDSHRFDDAEPALDRAMTLMNGTEPNDLLAKYVPSVERNLDFFGGALDRLLAGNRFESARRLAGALASKHVLPYPAPTVTAPITNGDFHIPAFHHGFDWFFMAPEGVTIDQFPESTKLRLTFNGRQPELCRLLRQDVILQPGTQYRMEWDAESESIPKNSGFTWRLIPIVTTITDNGPSATGDEKDMLSSPEVLADHGASNPTWTFTAPAVPLCLLVLEYHRNLGTTRPEGELALRSISMTPAH